MTAKKRGRPKKQAAAKAKKISITITPERLQKVDERGGKRSGVIGEMIDQAQG